MKGWIQFLGTGASAGVPMVGCSCEVCRSDNPKNTRLRTSARIQLDEMKEGGVRELLLDVSPDFRQQALTYSLPCPDALLLTHTHYDHVGGLEELRSYTIHRGHPIRCYLSKESFESIKKLYYYHFVPKSEMRNFCAQIDFHVLEASSGTFLIDSIPVHYFSYWQGDMPVTGYRIGNLAYVTDIKHYDQSLFSHLHDLDVLVVSALRYSPSRIQMTIDEALEFGARVGARRTYYIHLSHEIEYSGVQRALPKGVELAYDSLKVDFEISKQSD